MKMNGIFQEFSVSARLTSEDGAIELHPEVVFSSKHEKAKMNKMDVSLFRDSVLVRTEDVFEVRNDLRKMKLIIKERKYRIKDVIPDDFIDLLELELADER